jgi:DHA2 family methylenomycin A resistance protein-like MFS transporter
MGTEIRRRMVLAVMCAGMFLVLLDVSVVNVALPSIQTGLGTDLAGMQWVVDAYGITLASLLLAAGGLGDVRGHRRMVLDGLVIFGTASVGCGLAPTVEVLVTMRAAQGVGAALLLPSTMAVITHAFPGRAEQSRALGTWAGVSSLALPSGPLLGGALVSWLGWRAVFLVNVPVTLLAAAMVRRVVAESRGQQRVLDLPAAFAAVAGLACLVFAVITGGQRGLDRAVLVALVGVIAAAALFVRIERSASQPLVPLALLRSPTFVGANLVAGAMNFVGIGTVFAVTLYLQSVQGRSALTSGLDLLPLFVPLAALSPLAGRLTARLGPRPPMLLGLVIGAAGAFGLVRLQPESAYAVLLPPLLGLGLGMGLLTSAVVTAAMQSVPGERAGLASGMNNTARQAAGALGVACFGAVLGSAAAGASFVAHLHSLGVIAGLVWLAAAAVTAATVPGRAGPGPRGYEPAG